MAASQILFSHRVQQEPAALGAMVAKEEIRVRLVMGVVE
jgi:hypothetical protein